jgi:hypothetical protein
MRCVWIVAPAVVLAVAGCAEALKNNAIEKLEAECAMKGMQFVQEMATARDGLFVSTASVSGQCVGPGHPLYKQAL